MAAILYALFLFSGGKAAPQAQILYPNTDTPYYTGSVLSLIAYPVSEAVTYQWRFSDGTTYEGQTAIAEFPFEEPVTLTLTLIDADGNAGESDNRIIYPLGNFDYLSQPEVTAVTADNTAVRPGRTVRIEAQISDPENDGPFTFHWFWLEGGKPKRVTADRLETSFPAPAQEGAPYSVSVVAMDAAGHPSWPGRIDIYVLEGNLPPSGAIVEPADHLDVLTGTTVTFRASGTDPEGDYPLSFSWYLPDDSSAVGETVAFTFNEPGEFNVILTTTDSQGNQDPTHRVRRIRVQERDGLTAPETFVLQPRFSTRIFEGDSAIFNGVISGTDNTIPSFWTLTDVVTGETVLRVEGRQPGRQRMTHTGLLQVRYQAETLGVLSKPTSSNTTYLSVQARDSNNPPVVDYDGETYQVIRNGGTANWRVKVEDPDGDSVRLFAAFDGQILGEVGTAYSFPVQLEEDAFYKGIAVLQVELLAVDSRGKAPDQPLSHTIYVYQDLEPPRARVNGSEFPITRFLPLGGSLELTPTIENAEGLNLTYNWRANYFGEFSFFYESEEFQPPPFQLTKPGVAFIIFSAETTDGSLKILRDHLTVVHVYDPQAKPESFITKPNTDRLRVEVGETITLEGMAYDPNYVNPSISSLIIDPVISELHWEITGPDNFHETYRQDERLTITLNRPGTYTVAMRARNNLDLADETPAILTIEAAVSDPNAYEPNNTRETAAPLVVGSYGGFSVDDEDPIDWYRFHLAETGSAIEMTLDLTEAVDQVAVEIFQAEQSIYSGTLSGGQAHPLAFIGGDAGEYYLKLSTISPVKSSTGVSFGFSFSVSNPRLTFAYPKTDETDLTLLTLVNPLKEKQAQITLAARDRKGEVLDEASIQLPPGGHMERSVEELFPRTPSIKIAWVQVRADANVIGLSTTNGRDGQTSIAEPAIIGSLDALVIPHIAQDTAQWFTHASIVNASGENVDAIFRSKAGEQSLSQVKTTHESSIIDFEAFFGGSLPANNEWGTVVETAASPSLGGMEIFGTKTGSPRLAGLNLSNERWRNPNFTYRRKDIYFPHVAKDTQKFWTGIAFVNTAETQVGLQLVAYSDQGSELASQLIIMDPFDKKVGLAHTLFDDLDPSAQIGWIHLRTDGPIQGYALFGDNSGKNATLAGFPAVSGGSKELMFQKIYHSAGALWTGIAVVNLSESRPAHLTYTAYGADGGVIAEVTGRTVEPLRKEVQLVENLFGGTLPDGVKWIRLESDQPLAGFELFGDLNNTYLAGAIAQ